MTKHSEVHNSGFNRHQLVSRAYHQHGFEREGGGAGVRLQHPTLLQLVQDPIQPHERAVQKGHLRFTG